jgi:hypothetical protein
MIEGKRKDTWLCATTGMRNGPCFETLLTGEWTAFIACGEPTPPRPHRGNEKGGDWAYGF